MRERIGQRQPLSRREWMALGLGASAYAAAVPGETHQATGVKVGEMTPESARFWLRRTASSQRLAGGIVRKGHAKEAKLLPEDTPISGLEGSATGAEGYLRVVFRAGGATRSTKWVDADGKADFTVQSTLSGLRPATEYTYTVETRAARSRRVDGEVTGRFRTLPLATSTAPALVNLLSCQMYCHMDRPDGFHIYESIARDNPAFLLSCGDNVYYDNEDPIANRASVAHYHWQRMYSLPTVVNCLRQVGGYWQKDDHDVLSDDAWPAMEPKKMAPFTFAEGQRIFREQVPAPLAGQPMYRTVRVGADLELWLLESRDYRTPNTMADGPEKTIWGAVQKEWLWNSLKASSAEWKVIVSPNPIVGPDRQTKNDNHANAGFATESHEVRRFLQREFPGNVFVVCGDRHWQYHSVDPATQLHEFGCGAASDEHAGGTPGQDPLRHRFHRVLGGYLSIDTDRDGKTPRIRFRHRDVRGAVMHEYARKRMP